MGRYRAVTYKVMLDLDSVCASRPPRIVRRSADLHAHVKPFRDSDDAGVEHVYVVYLDTALHVIAVKSVSTGNETQTLVSRKSILRDALLLGASAFAIAHNHPTGVLEPSSEDRALTRALDEAAKIVGLNFVDHIIIADPPNGSGYYSFADNGLMKAA